MLDDILTFDEKNIKIIFRSFLGYEGGAFQDLMSNDFEQVIFPHHPILKTARDQLLKAGAITAGLCGSGSALFGIFDGNNEALAASMLSQPPWLSFVFRPC